MTEQLTTPAGAERYRKNELRPLPTRISQSSYERLEAIRKVDDLSIQEHVRRAIDYYLEHVEVSLALAASGGVQVAAKVIGDVRGRTPEVVPELLADHAPRAIRQPAKVTPR